MKENSLILKWKIYIECSKSTSQSLSSPPIHLQRLSLTGFVRSVRRRDRRMTNQASSQTLTLPQRLSAGGCVVVDHGKPVRPIYSNAGSEGERLL